MGKSRFEQMIPLAGNRLERPSRLLIPTAAKLYKIRRVGLNNSSCLKRGARIHSNKFFRTQPDATGPNRTEPERFGSNRTEPHRAGQNRADSDQTGPGTTPPPHGRGPRRGTIARFSPPFKTWGYSKGWPGKQGENRSPLVVALIFFLVGPPPGCDIDEAVSIEMVVAGLFEMLYSYGR